MRQVLFVFLLSLFGFSAQAQTLVLANDVSQSMNSTSLDTQFQAYATLLAGPLHHQLVGQRVVVVLFGNSAATVSNGDVDDAVAAFAALADPAIRSAVINDAFNWTPPSGPSAVGRAIAGPRDSTCVGVALKFIHKLSVDLPPPIVVDISGDGADNCYDDTVAVAKAMLEDDIVINSLPMGNDDVAAWYKENVTTGFQISASGVNDFEAALFEKLMGEVAMLDPQKY